VMGTEIERKFLVIDDSWGPADDGSRQRQGYLAITDRGNVRVRIEHGVATLTLKGLQRGLTRDEFEYRVPLEDGERILETLCLWVAEKTRYKRRFGGHTWEIDVFHGENDGLVTAEVELGSEDEEVVLPPWVGEDVSHDRRYRVAWLSRHPWREWGDDA